MRQTTFAKSAAAHAPTARTSRKAQRKWRVFVGFQARLESQLARLLAKQFIDRFAEQMFAGAIDEAQTTVRIKREHRDFDLGHDRPQQRCGFERAQALKTQSFT